MTSWIEAAGDLKFAQENGAMYHDYLAFLLSANCLKNGILYYSSRVSGRLAGKIVTFTSFFREKGLIESISRLELIEDYVGNTYTSETGVVSLWYNSGQVTIEYTTTDKKFAEELNKLFTENTKDLESEGQVFVLADTQNGPIFQPVGIASSALIKENYSEKVISNLEHIVEDLKKDNPCGAISIFSGPPGTGKTYLIRSIIDLVPNSMFVVVPPEMVQAICKPHFIRAVIANREQYKQRASSMVLLIEDADQILAPRGSDNMADISSMLNISDGILGKILNIRILATTNAKQQEFESAALRAGRLCRHIYLGELDQEHCQKVIARLGVSKETLMANKYNPDKKYILADLYKMSRQDTAEESAQEKLPLGFNK